MILSSVASQNRPLLPTGAPQWFGFMAGSALSFVGLTGLFWCLYGYDFIDQGLLYHLVRTDHRHNFGLYFYAIYLTFEQPSRLFRGLALFVPQITILLVSSLILGQDLPVALLVQVVSFVTFNKVCTAQYFTW